MSTALVVIGVQNFFCVDKAKDLPHKIAAHIRASSYDHVLFALFRNHPESNFYRALHFTEANESPEIDVHPAVAEFATPATTFEKASYSAFKCDGFCDYITQHNITQLDLCGADYDACVLATAFEAFDLGYDLTILDTLCAVSCVRSDIVHAAEKIIDRNLRSGPDRVQLKRW